MFPMTPPTNTSSKYNVILNVKLRNYLTENWLNMYLTLGGQPQLGLFGATAQSPGIYVIYFSTCISMYYNTCL